MPNFWRLALLLHQFSKFNNFLMACWVLGNRLSNFVSLDLKLHNRYCHNAQEFWNPFQCIHSMGALVRNVTVTPLAQNQLFVMNIVVNANVRKTLSDVNARDVLQHFMVLDKMVVQVSFVVIKIQTWFSQLISQPLKSKVGLDRTGHVNKKVHISSLQVTTVKNKNKT